jgi:apolipoprotein N-acyltransferase
MSILTGVLLTVSWPVNGFTPFIFVALVPLLIVQQYLGDNNKRGMFWYSWLAFFIWNILSTWWIWNSTAVGSLMAFMLNSLFTATVFQLYHLSKKKLFDNKKGAALLIFYWISWEFIHMNWDLTWSWMNLGNVFASKHTWIQWYEYTGSLGGTLWVLVVNIIIFEIIRSFINRSAKTKQVVFIVTGIVTIVVPLVISYSIYNSYEEEINPVEVVVVQPNVDPYNEQYSVGFRTLLERNLDLADTKMSESTNFIVFPESALQEDIWEEHLDRSVSLNRLKTELTNYPNTTIVIGATSYRNIREDEKPTNAARKFRSREGMYYAYNTAFLIESEREFQKHHKSKLTPGVEIMPSWWILKPVEKLAIDLGGTTGTLGRETEPVAFFPSNNIPVSPIICYESVYGEFVANSVKLGSGLIFVITNDGWWGNTPGYKQHLLFSVLRAVETRRSVARSANTGVSAFINQKGDIIEKTGYWEPAVIKQDLNANFDLTYYVVNGDYLGRISSFVSALLLLIAFTQGYLKKKKSLAR